MQVTRKQRRDTKFMLVKWKQELRLHAQMTALQTTAHTRWSFSWVKLPGVRVTLRVMPHCAVSTQALIVYRPFTAQLTYNSTRKPSNSSTRTKVPCKEIYGKSTQKTLCQKVHSAKFSENSDSLAVQGNPRSSSWCLSKAHTVMRLPVSH